MMYWGRNSPYLHRRTVLGGPGALIAETWAVMQHTGEKYMARSPSLFAWLTSSHHCSGYLRSAKYLITVTREIIQGIRTEVPERCILGNPWGQWSPLGRRRVLEPMFQKWATR